MKHRALPLDFSLRNGNDEAVLYLDGLQDLTLTLYNTSLVPLVLNELTKEHHFKLRFRAGTLQNHKLIGLDDAGRKQWHLDVKLGAKDVADDAGRDVVIGLRHKGSVTWPPGGTLRVVLEALRGQVAGGTRATRVELDYDHIRQQDEGHLLPSSKPRHHQMVLTMAAPRQRRDQPLLQAHFAGDAGNYVLNDGSKEASPIVLRLTNTTAQPLGIGPGTAFHLTIPFGPEDRPGALASKEALRGCTVGASLLPDVSVEDTSMSLQCSDLVETDGQTSWKFYPPENIGPDFRINPEGSLDIRIEGLATRHRNGPSPLHVDWVNLDPDGRDMTEELVATLQKSPMVVRGQRLGIGTSQPKAALDVRGDLRIDGPVTSPGPLNFDTPVNANAGLVVEGSRVGSGTSQPKPTLDVRGNVTIAGRISSPGPLEFDTLLKADAGLALGGVRLVARTLRDELTTRTEFHHVYPYNLESFWRFDDWQLDLATLDPGNVVPPWGRPKSQSVAPVFSLPLPADAMPPLALRGAFRVRVSAEASDGSLCPVSFAGPTIPVTVTSSGGALTATVDMAGARQYPVPEVPVPLGGPIPSVAFHSWLDAGCAGDVSRLRDMLAAKSVQLRDWGASFGEKGVHVRWTVEATCTVSVLLAEIGDPS